ncbi:glucosyltransferase domain-containing protein [bacterium]|nr:glucosyltransferase domain-containing protein [bacterium]
MKSTVLTDLYHDIKKHIYQRFATIFIASFLTILCYSKYMFNTYFYQDTGPVILNQGTTYNWLSIGRFGLVLVRRLLGTVNANPYYTAVLFILFSVTNAIVWSFLVQKCVGGKFSNATLTIFYGLFITYPALSEQFYFQFQSCEIMLGYILVGISLIFLFIHINQKKGTFFIASVLVATLAFSIYQSFVNVYITACLGCFALCLIADIRKPLKKLFTEIGYNLLHFCLALILYGLLNAVFSTYGTESDYFSSRVSLSISAIINRILVDGPSFFERLFFGDGVFFLSTLAIASAAMAISLVFFYVTIFLNNKICASNTQLYINLGILLFVCATLVISPLLLSLIIGLYEARIQLAVPISVAYLFLLALWLLQHVHFPRVRILPLLLGGVSLVCVARQTNSLMRIFYTYDIINENATIQATQISYDLDRFIAENGDLPVAFIGSMEAKVNAACCALVPSYFFNSPLMQNEKISPAYFYGSAWLTDYYKYYGITYQFPTDTQIHDAALYAVDMPIWPSTDSIQVVDGVIIVKIGPVDESLL